MRFSFWLLAAAFLSLSAARAAEFTGRFSILGTAARAQPGDAGHIEGGNNTLTADQQSLRLMLDDTRDNAQSSAHLKMARQRLRGYSAAGRHSSDLFRYGKASGDWLDENNGNSATRVGYELDRAVYKHRFDNVTASVGRQPIDWGSGRFWQPLNVFGAFAPTDLDTDFKPGIDAAVMGWYPSAFSSVTAVYALSPANNASIENSAAVHYRRQAGERSELSMVAGRVIGNKVIGAAFESDWGGMGWRIEGAHYTMGNTDKKSLFWIAGVDYQFENGTLVAAEWYENNRGASAAASLGGMRSDQLVAYGLQQHLGRRVLGISAEKDITPLLRGGYKLLISALKDADSQMAASALHQFNLVYSMSNESDLLLSLQLAKGRGLNQRGEPQTEFGHVPAAITVRMRFYF